MDGRAAAAAIAFDATVPLHHQVYLQLRCEIGDGLWADRKFPGEHEVANQFGVSVITARAALERLARTAGCTVSAAAARPSSTNRASTWVDGRRRS